MLRIKTGMSDVVNMFNLQVYILEMLLVYMYKM